MSKTDVKGPNIVKSCKAGPTGACKISTNHAGASLHPLENTWCMWYHNGETWKKEDYFKLMEFNSIEDFWALYNNHPPLNVGHIFLMKKGVFPSWEDNVNGERWSFKTQKSTLFNTWLELTMGLVGRYLINDYKKMDAIDGIEIQSHQKYKYGIIKIWMAHHINPAFDHQITNLEMNSVKILPNNKS